MDKKIHQHTFVICAYKESPYLEECICSLKEQTISSIIMLATSTPSKYLEVLCEKYQIDYCVRNDTPGIAPDWNYALSLAQTPYVTIAHQDDVYEPEYTKKIIETAEQRGGEGGDFPIILFTDYSELIGKKKYLDRRNLKIKRMILWPMKNKKNQSRIVWKRWILRFGNAVCCPTVTYHKKYIDELLRMNNRDELFKKHFRSNLDWEAWEWLSCQKGEFVYIASSLMAHRIHEGSETTATIRDNLRGKEDFEMFCKFWPKWIARLLAGVYGTSEKGNTV